MCDGEAGSGLWTQEPRDAASLEPEDFATMLLAALTAMANRNRRRQADLAASLRAARLAHDPVRVRAALGVLQAQGCIEKLVPLSDGGLLLTVCRSAPGGPGSAPRWLAPGDLADMAG